MEKHFNGLTPAEHERLTLIMEEAGEVVQAIGKILRHGYENFNPFDEEKTTNRKLLEKELGDFQWAVGFAIDSGDLDGGSIFVNNHLKSHSVRKYLHHNTVSK